MAARDNVQPKADQPRVTTGELKRGSQPATLQYRITGVKSFDRSPSQRSYGRTVRGQFMKGCKMYKKMHKGKGRKTKR